MRHDGLAVAGRQRGRRGKPGHQRERGHRRSDEARRHPQQGHDRRRDQGCDRRRGLGRRRQLDVHGERRAREPVPEVRQGHVWRRHQADLRGHPAAEHVPDEARCREGRWQPGALRRDRRRGELLGRRHRPGPRRHDLPVRPHSERVDGPRHLQARPDDDRVPVDRVPRRRVQQVPRGLDEVPHGPGRPAAQGQADPAATW